MEDSWQVKCSSAFQSLTSSMASSSSSHVLHNQMEGNAGYYPYPLDPHDLRRKVHGAVLDTLFPNYPNLGSERSTQVSLGNSFLALLSGPASLLQCDLKEVSNSKLTSDVNGVVVNAVGGAVSSTFNGLPLECPNEQNLQLGRYFCPSISTRIVAGSNFGSNSVFPVHQTPEHESAVTHGMVAGSEKGKSSVSMSDQSPSLLSNCPRVFCLGTGGYLLISNSGLLGIVCSCHNLHMSVLKFCEHSGLYGGNAGDFVRMESGETIAVWRKLYFLKFGIRIPEDQSGWDWPEGLTTANGLVKSRTSVPNNSCKVSHLDQSFDGSLRPEQVSDGAIVSHRNSAIDASLNNQKRNTYNSDNAPFKGSIGTSQSNTHVVANSQIMVHPLSGFLTVPRSLSSGPQDDCQCTTTFTDTILKNGDSSVIYPLQDLRTIAQRSDFCVCKGDPSIIRPTMQDFRIVGQKSDFSTCRSGPNSVFVGGDTAFSNIELKLGQPYQSSQNSMKSDRPALGSRLLESCENPSRLIFAQQMIHNPAGFQSKVELKKTADQSNSIKESEKSKLHLSKNGYGNSNVNNAAKLSTDRTTPNPQHYEPCFSKCDSSNIPWNYRNGLQRQLISTEMGSPGHTDKSRGTNYATNGPYFTKDSDSGSTTRKETETSTSHTFFSATQVSNGDLHQLSSAPLEASVARRLSGNIMNIPSFGNNLPVDHMNPRLLTPNFGSQQILPSRMVTRDIPLASSACLPDAFRALPREEASSSSTHLLDDNLRMLALRQMLELSKQQHASSAGMNRWEGRCNGISHFHHPVVESLDLEERHGRPGPSGCSDAGVRAYLAGPTNANSCCDLSTLIRGISIQAKEIAVQSQLSSDPILNEQSSMSRSQKDILGPSEQEKCCRLSSVCFQQGCNCSVHMSSERNLAIGGSGSYMLQEQRGKVNGESSVSCTAKFPQNQIGPTDEIPSAEQEATSNGNPSKNIVRHVSQWRDVPSKAKGISNIICRDTPSKCNNIPQKLNSFKELGNSNISSGSSAPAITQLSVEVSNMGSSGDVAGNTGCVSNAVVDEGSGIDKCWSSDDAHGSEKSAELSEKNSGHSVSSLNANHQSSRSLLDELKLINSLTWKKDQKQLQMEMTLQKKDSLSHKFTRCLEKEKRKKDCSLIGHCKSYERTNSTDFLLSAPKTVQKLSLPKSSSSAHGFSSSSMKKPILKRDIYKLYNSKEGKDDCQPASAGSCEIPEVSAGKKYKRGCSNEFDQSQIGGGHGGARTMEKYTSLGCMKSSFNSQAHDYRCISRPIVCGKYGELSNGEFRDMEKPAKIVPLSRVLKSARRCSLPKNDKPTLSSVRELKKSDVQESMDSYSGSHLLNKEEGNKSQGDKTKNESSLGEMKNGWSSKDNKFAVDLPILEVDKHHSSKKDCREEDNTPRARLKSKTKEIRKRSIYELTVDGKGHHETPSLSQISKCFPEIKEGKILSNRDDRNHGICKVDEKSSQEQTCSTVLNLDSSCCVCSSSIQDELNCLLECKTCSIKVHQACYGVSRVPKGHWYCRPCRTSSRNMACVLCGYGGGAMTGALRSHTIVKSLLRVWNFEPECKPKTVPLPAKNLEDLVSGLNSYDAQFEGSTSSPKFQIENTKPLPSVEGKIDVPYHLDASQNSTSVAKLKVDNSITVGLLNSTTKQWVHMVCGLWTPGTRCPNVVTMSAFDVSGALHPRADVVCSFCNRPGGICIKCRILNCSVHFHPWCAHQKGLLHSEVEGVENESIGFYGRCILHATNPVCESDSDQADGVAGGSGIDELKCAKTEGYSGRKCDGKSKRKFGCHVPQEQLDAWIHINGQKSGIQALQKLPISDVEHDCRKEYARYKQGRGWKHLVVYKSGIHALGLYTSRFISRGEMVVEYIGEIVGLRVSDKREKEYQSGRKLQYKSACYFFRLDKEHIIDATRKGGIARFVNHSCLPNCVAKVISIKNDKKVVFFAERDIFPGEEITYDYHFNHEDEGKKIPCFCNSKNCRRFLN